MGERTRPRVSLVIPAHDEEAYLPRLLDSVDRARQTYDEGPDRVEVIVVDDASTDGTSRVAEERGCRVVPVERRIIGAVRNAGARAARGEVLAFVDADAQIHPETFHEIDRLIEDPAVVGGATGVRFERTSVGLRLTYALVVAFALSVRGARTRRPFNIDSGVVFCRRRDFRAVGGFPEDLLYAEDVRFLLALKRLGRARGQKLVSGTDAPAVFSTRKFDRHGDWHYFLMPLRIAWSLATGREDWVRAYWYGDRPAP